MHQSLQSLHKQGRYWLEAEEEDTENLADIYAIVSRQLKEIKKLKDISAARCIKMTTHLTAVVQYVRLREQYRNHGRVARHHALKASSRNSETDVETKWRLRLLCTSNSPKRGLPSSSQTSSTHETRRKAWPIHTT